MVSLVAVNQCLPQRATAAARRGAAELDAEFYLRGLLGQPPSPPVKTESMAPRQLSGTVACALLNATTSALAIALDCGTSEVLERSQRRRPALSIEYERAVLSGAFGATYDVAASTATKLPLDGGSSACQSTFSLYDFELSLYTLFTLLSEARLPAAQLKTWYTFLGDRLLAAAYELAPPQLPAATSLKQLDAGLDSLLSQLRRGGYIKGFSVNSDADETLWALKNELSITRYTLTLSDPASLRASTQLNAATGGRVTAGLAVPLLSAYLRAQGVAILQASEYFLDDEYKPNPMEYRPSSLVVEFELAPAV